MSFNIHERKGEKKKKKNVVECSVGKVSDLMISNFAKKKNSYHFDAGKLHAL